MIKDVPRNKAFSLQCRIRPGQHFEIVFHVVFAVPLNKSETSRLRVFVEALGESCLTLRRPDFNRPRKHALMIVHPIIENARNHLFRVILEIMKHRNARIPREFRSLLSNFLVRPEIFGGHRVVILSSVRTQQNTAIGMKGHPARDVGMGRNKFQQIVNLRFRTGKISCAYLFRFLSPVRGEVAVEIESLFVARNRLGYTVIIFKRSFPQDSVVSSARLCWLSASQ